MDAGKFFETFKTVTETLSSVAWDCHMEASVSFDGATLTLKFDKPEVK